MNLRNHDTTNLKPFGPRVTCHAPPDMDENTARVLLPDGVRSDLTAGIVVDIGEEMPGDLAPGDLIFFSHICNQLGDLYIIEGPCIVAYEKLTERDHGGHLA